MGLTIILTTLALAGCLHTAFTIVPIQLDEVAFSNRYPQCRLRQRSNAINKRSVVMYGGENLEFKFCIPEGSDVEVLVGDIVYSNDGWVDNITVAIDDEFIGDFQSTDISQGGYLWNDFLHSGALGGRTVDPGMHTVTINVTDADRYGIEFDHMIIIVGDLSEEDILCDDADDKSQQTTPITDRCSPGEEKKKMMTTSGPFDRAGEDATTTSSDSTETSSAFSSTGSTTAGETSSTSSTTSATDITPSSATTDETTTEEASTTGENSYPTTVPPSEDESIVMKGPNEELLTIERGNGAFCSDDQGLIDYNIVSDETTSLSVTVTQQFTVTSSIHSSFGFGGSSIMLYNSPGASIQAYETGSGMWVTMGNEDPVQCSAMALSAPGSEGEDMIPRMVVNANGNVLLFPDIHVASQPMYQFTDSETGAKLSNIASVEIVANGSSFDFLVRSEHGECTPWLGFSPTSSEIIFKKTTTSTTILSSMAVPCVRTDGQPSQAAVSADDTEYVSMFNWKKFSGREITLLL